MDKQEKRTKWKSRTEKCSKWNKNSLDGFNRNIIDDRRVNEVEDWATDQSRGLKDSKNE